MRNLWIFTDAAVLEKEHDDEYTEEAKEELPPLVKGTKISKIFEMEDGFEITTGTLVECGSVEGKRGPHWLVSYEDGEQDQRSETELADKLEDELNNVGEPEIALGTNILFVRIFSDITIE